MVGFVAFIFLLFVIGLRDIWFHKKVKDDIANPWRDSKDK